MGTCELHPAVRCEHWLEEWRVVRRAGVICAGLTIVAGAGIAAAIAIGISTSSNLVQLAPPPPDLLRTTIGHLTQPLPVLEPASQSFVLAPEDHIVVVDLDPAR